MTSRGGDKKVDVEPLDLAGLEARAAALDAAALAAPDIDRFCSSSSWVLPAAVALQPGGEPLMAVGEAGFLAMVVRPHGDRVVAEALEASWGLACPLVGPAPGPLVESAAEILRRREPTWEVLVLSGLPLGSLLLTEVARVIARRYRFGRGPVTRRHLASLAGGVDGFLARRSRGLRKGVRSALVRAADAGVVFGPVTLDDPDRIYPRLLAIESRSWKGRDGVGLGDPVMREFYRSMIRRLGGAARLLVARRGEEEVAFVLGAVFGDTYRGLQFSFDDRYRHLALGNLAQVHQVVALAAEPAVTRYDLGTGGDYKRAWAETVSDSVSLIAAR